jgi:pimeloyl-ACP methyl ester carboxylesterase
VVLFASVVVVVVLLMVLFSWVFQRRLIYLPSTGAVPSAASMVAGVHDVKLMTSDGLQLEAWYIPARSSASTFTVLVANGNAGARSLRAPLARALANQGFGVLLFDYRGYGGNPGSPSDEGLARDVRAARQFLTDEGVPITVVYGTEDSIVPPGESRRSVAAARGPTRLVAVQGADHNDPALLNGNVLVQAVVAQASGSGGT